MAVPSAPSTSAPVISTPDGAAKSGSPPVSIDGPTLRLTMGLSALSPMVEVSPSDAWSLHLANDTEAISSEDIPANFSLLSPGLDEPGYTLKRGANTVAHLTSAFAGDGWSLRGEVFTKDEPDSSGLGLGTFFLDGESKPGRADLTAINGSGYTEVISAGGWHSGWHNASFNVTSSTGSLRVLGVMWYLPVVTDVGDEASFAALEQRVPLAPEAGDVSFLEYSGSWSHSPSAPDQLLINVPANTSLFALSGSRGPGSGSFDVVLNPPSRGRSRYTANTELSRPVDGLTFFAAPLDPTIAYTLEVSSHAANLSAVHFWPQSSSSFLSWKRDDWTPATPTFPGLPASPTASKPLPSSNGTTLPWQTKAAIIGGCVGGGVFVALLGLCVYVGYRRWNSRRHYPQSTVAPRGISGDVLEKHTGIRRYSTMGSTDTHEMRLPTPARTSPIRSDFRINTPSSFDGDAFAATPAFSSRPPIKAQYSGRTFGSEPSGIDTPHAAGSCVAASPTTETAKHSVGPTPHTPLTPQWSPHSASDETFQTDEGGPNDPVLSGFGDWTRLRPTLAESAHVLQILPPIIDKQGYSAEGQTPYFMGSRQSSGETVTTSVRKSVAAAQRRSPVPPPRRVPVPSMWDDTDAASLVDKYQDCSHAHLDESDNRDAALGSGPA